ncbi:hypothetical protein SAMN05216203_0428 [Marinobacter daqiaonensis]|uniref:DUF192 domain-containing protein n=1 Tax=Marinobacter daqiaonensis TaxID=650891 RepID=A0A1I6GST1_9GAMM|nr:DUF192 domain-containing protein [Marinobacter daqiaonensis]SFR45097.1 hypothetical protein SAMN05216203_0428 [Marinobacter daqiaonensis]
MALLRQCILLALICVAIPAVSADEGPPQFLEARPACLVTDRGAVHLKLERATTDRQRRIGLMERKSLPPERGMVFLYEDQRSANAGFWMYRTRIPLDIAWLDEQGVIINTDTMTPCTTPSAILCPTWEPGVSHRMVLEVNAGFFEENHVDKGDKLILNPKDHKECQTGV